MELKCNFFQCPLTFASGLFPVAIVSHSCHLSHQLDLANVSVSRVSFGSLVSVYGIRKVSLQLLKLICGKMVFRGLLN